MAQRIIINQPSHKIEKIIGDDELSVFEFQEFWLKVKKETNISIDAYSGAGIDININRKFALLLTNQLYKIEDEFPDKKISVYDKNKQITKPVVIRFFRDILKILDKANKAKVSIYFDGE
jgi:hypothetical protein